MSIPALWAAWRIVQPAGTVAVTPSIVSVMSEGMVSAFRKVSVRPAARPPGVWHDMHRFGFPATRVMAPPAAPCGRWQLLQSIEFEHIGRNDGEFCGRKKSLTEQANYHDEPGENEKHIDHWFTPSMWMFTLACASVMGPKSSSRRSSIVQIPMALPDSLTTTAM